MYENKFDQALDEISTLSGCEWTDHSKLRIMSRFMGTHPELLHEFEKFVNQQAEDETLSEDAGAEDDT